MGPHGWGSWENPKETLGVRFLALGSTKFAVVLVMSNKQLIKLKVF